MSGAHPESEGQIVMVQVASNEPGFTQSFRQKIQHCLQGIPDCTFSNVTLIAGKSICSVGTSNENLEQVRILLETWLAQLDESGSVTSVDVSVNDEGPVVARGVIVTPLPHHGFGVRYPMPHK